MSDAKPFASLSPTLLARKGAARPAMRSQLQALNHYPALETAVPAPPHAGAAADPHDDLGWNDMGEHRSDGSAMAGPPVAAPASTVVPFGPAEAAFEPSPVARIPEVVRQQDALAGQLDAEKPADAGRGPDEPSALIPIARHRWGRQTPPVRRSALAEGRRAAFTLRVDDERHLKLRLACTVQGRSAQQLVTEALDRLLDQLPELDDLAKRVRRR